MYEYFYTIAISKTVPRVKESVMISTGTLKWVTNVKCRWQNSPISSFIKNLSLGNSLAVQWLGLLSFYCGGLGSICGQATKILQATRLDQKKKKSQTESEFIQSFHSNSELRKSERRYSTWVPQEKAISLKNVFLGINIVHILGFFSQWTFFCVCCGENTQDLLSANFKNIVQYY